MTVDGFSGKVTAVNEGPGNESYQVTLDGGLGGGEYSASQLSPKTEAAQYTAAVDVCALASYWYPELADVLVERPDIAANTRWASMSATAGRDEDDWGDDYDQCPECSQMVSTNRTSMQDHLHDEHDADPDDYTKAAHSAWEKNAKVISDDKMDRLKRDYQRRHPHVDAVDDEDEDKDAGWLLDQQHTGPTKYSALWGIVTTAAADSDFRFEVTAAWSDVRNKAKRIRATGGVNVTLATSGIIVGEVKGDHNVYESGIQRMPGRMAIQAWSCGCKWGAYHWGADDDFSRFAGRMCSHALALQYEAQSRGMFGRDVKTDHSKPSWTKRMVVVKHDIDAGRDVEAPATRLSALETVTGALVTALRGSEPFEDVALAFQSAGLNIHAALRAEAAVNDAWGEPSPNRVQYTPGPTKPSDPTENPASAGWASAPEPDSWSEAGPSGLNHLVSSLDDEAIFEPEMSKEAWLQFLLPLVEPLLAGAGGAAAGAGAAEVAGAGAAAAGAAELGAGAAGAAGAAEVGAGAAGAAGAGEAAGGGLVRSLAPKLIQNKMLNEMLPGDKGEEGPKGPGKPKPKPPGPFHPSPQTNRTINTGVGIQNVNADLHEQPEGALPSTDGADDDLYGAAGDPRSPEGLEPDDIGFASTGSVADVVAQFQATAGAQHLQEGSQGAPGAANDGLDIAAAARAFLATGEQPGMQTTALKEFTLAEQRKIIDEGEGEGVKAANLDRLDLTGTHYAPLEAALAAADNDDEEWLV